MPTTVSIALTPPQDDAARAAIRDYLTDIVGRYYGRSATPAEIETVLADAAPDDAFLEPPHGLFWLARDGDTILGCAGLRFTGDGIGLVTRVWTAPAARRRGIASSLLTTLEAAARGHGLTLLRLDTRSDLVEARALYARHGFTEIPAFNDDPYADHWFAKDLTEGPWTARTARERPPSSPLTRPTPAPAGGARSPSRGER
ncbi:GNAT family N-acetyltransferase [Catellatospora bangladeshensis]|uniref:N-acetyltransferase n=1 Tax=Catellatospora bangladeshensis TaxID=310355 RepID=A0A8J3JQQ8_9ACTN|nr:GNAT family N-acetyltransferase [Catellatospora bangladeshensis]GIF85192.1 N-acetyltransferase [Catellatospora bangladeshensis]